MADEPVELTATQWVILAEWVVCYLGARVCFRLVYSCC